MVAAATDGLSPTTLAGLALVIGAMGLFLWRVVRTFLRHIEAADEKAATALITQGERFTAALADHRQQTERFLGNHMSGQTHAMERVADQLEAINAEARRAHDMHRATGR